MADDAEVRGWSLRWPAGPVALDLDADADGPVLVRGLSPAGTAGATGAGGAGRAAPWRGPGVPLVEIDCLGHGRTGGLRYAGHECSPVPSGELLVVRQRDTGTGLAVATSILLVRDTGVLRIHHEVGNSGAEPLVLTYVSSLSLTGFAAPAPGAPGAGAGPLAEFGTGLTLHVVRNTRAAELRWQELTMDQAGLVSAGPCGAGSRSADACGADACGADTDGAGTDGADTDGAGTGGVEPGARYPVTARGSWSTGEHLPMGALTRAADGSCPAVAWLWQIEPAGGWHWEVGEFAGDLYLRASGPTDAEHQWRRPLAPGERFTTVPAAVLVTTGDVTDGLRRLTAYRRAVRRPATEHRALSVVFNDRGGSDPGGADPDGGRLAALVSAAAGAGCEYFVLDPAGYSGDPDWWSGLGEWWPAPVRFPGGLAAATWRIRDAGMAPGVRLEPEAVGAGSRIARQLPADAYFQLGGARIAEDGRYHLDFRCPAVREHLDAVVDRLAGRYGVRYLQLDSRAPVAGTDVHGTAPGAGLLGHVRAYRDWLDAVQDRHPGLVLENRAGGGARLDGGALSRVPVQAVSDQRDPLRAAAIAAAAPVAVPPEQAALRVRLRPEDSPEEMSFRLVGAALGRLHLHGPVDGMTVSQRERVRAAVAAYRRYRPLLATGLPYWPLGLPGWYHPWLALAVAGADEALLAIWCRDPRGGAVELPLPWATGGGWRATPVFPASAPLELDWSPGARVLAARLPAGPAARLVRLWR